MTARKLGDLGERRIVSEILAPRYSSQVDHFGDDCVAIAQGEGFLIVTTDPCPLPMATQLGFSDPFYRGWLLATINLSDLAAAGARPLGLLTSLQLPAETTLAEFERLLDGVDACCAHHNTSVLGGNLKEATAVDVSATALGWCDGPPVGRSGARPGDCVMVFGPLGLFWAGVLGVRNALIDADAELPLLRTVLRPDAQLSTGQAMRRSGVLSAVIDCSDGLWPSLLQIAEASGVRMIVEPAGWSYSFGVEDIAGQLKVEPARLALGWGDWQLVGTCPPERVDEACSLAKDEGCEVHQLGSCCEGAGVLARGDGEPAPLLALDSQRFAADSWFSAGIETYIQRMLNEPLYGTAD